MKKDHALGTIPATPEGVLAVLVDSHRQQCGYDPEADASIQLSFDSTIDDWRIACDLVDGASLGAALNEEFGLSCSTDQWLEVLEPSESKKLRSVCELIALTGRLERFLPASSLGGSCLAAGVFRSIRSMLGRRGVDVRSLRPSSDLRPYLRSLPGFFAHELGKIVPGILPAIKIHTPVYDAFVFALVISIFGMPIAIALASVWVALIFGAIMISCFVGIRLVVRHVLPSRVELGTLRTFADLCRHVAVRLPEVEKGASVK
jgi:hypothetical protein